MTIEEKLERIKKLADDMYYASANLGSNVGSGERLRKTMKEYHQFIIHECKEEPVSEQILSNVERIGKNWKEESGLNWKDMSLQEKKDLLASLQKDIEPLSEDFETALEKKVREAQDWTYIEEEGGECPLNEEFGADDLEEFARWGAEWVRNNKKEPTSKELTDEIKLWLKQWSENEMEWSREDIWDTAEHFANWQKQQMVKDAISAKVTEIYYPTDSCLEIEATLPEGRFKDGDKVLIIKED